MSPFHADGLRGFAQHDGHEFIHLRKKFRPDTPDIEWITKLGEEGDWIVISGDTRITRNPTEKRAWIESTLTGFFLAEPWMNDQYWKKTAALVKWFPEIARQAKKTPKHHGWQLPKSGSELRKLFPD